MKFTYPMFAAFIGGFITQYFILPLISIQHISDFTNNVGKTYLSIIAGLFMTSITVASRDHQYGSFSTNTYIMLLSLIAMLIYCYRKQFMVNDNNYVKSLNEQQSNILFMSKEILKKSDDYETVKLAKETISQLTDK